MDPLSVAAIMAGVGLGKSLLIDKPAAQRHNWLQAQTQRYSPWTGLRAEGLKYADPFGAAMQGGVSGYAQGQNMQANEMNQKLAGAFQRNQELENMKLQKELGMEEPEIAPVTGAKQETSMRFQNPWARKGVLG